MLTSPRSRVAGLRPYAALAIAAAATAVLPATPAPAAPADLDPTFGTGGVTVVDDGGHETATDVATAPDGSVVVVGYSTDGPDQDALVFRLRPDGTRDTGFGVQHLTGPVPIATGYAAEQAHAVAVQPDGKIVVAGRTSTNQDGSVWRLLPSGAPDLGFGGGDGLALLDSSPQDALSDVALAPDGAIVAVGTAHPQESSAVVHRLSPGGVPDSGFDGEGQTFVGGAYGDARTVAVQPDGKVVVGGYFGGPPSGAGMVVRRLLPSGAPDADFGGGDGEASTAGFAGSASDLTLQADGRIVVAGSYDGSTGLDGALVRYTTSGREDSTYGSEPGVRFDLGGDEHLFAVEATPDGGVVAAGSAGVDGGRALVVRVGPDGHGETSFGTGGAVAVPGPLGNGSAVATSAGGKVVVAGQDRTTAADVVVVRLGLDVPTGTPAPTLTCRGRAATLVGTPGKDRITGTRKADVIVALGGDDNIKGLGGDDLVCAGDGADSVKGGPGKDRLRGERGKDRLVGGPGKDRLSGGPDRDTTRP